MYRITHLVFILSTFFALTITNCSLRETSVKLGNRGQVLHIGNYAEPQDLDPHIITGVTEFNIISALLEGLVSEDPKDLHPVPGVAESWEISPDALTYTFHLRKNAKWSNSDPVTAYDFAYSFRRILSPALGSEYAYMLYVLKNGEAFHKQKVTDFSKVGISIPDSFTLILNLEHPTPYFLQLISHNSWLPVQQKTIEKFGAIDQRGTRWTKPENFVGNGPFNLAQWDMNKVIVVKKSETYWDKETVKLMEIHFYPVESAQTEERMFRSGQLHVTYTVPANRIDFYKQEHPDLMHIDPYLTTYYYLININRPPLDNVKVRKALAMSIDRESIVKNVTKGGEAPAYNFTPPNTNGYTATARMSSNIDQAKAWLAEAGYPEGKGFPAIEILYNTKESHQLIAQAIQEMWRKNLGIQVSLVNQEWKVYLDAQSRKDYWISRAGWTGDYNDPTTFLDLWVTGGGNNRTGWSNAQYDSLIQTASLTLDNTKRFEFFQKAEQLLLDDASIIPIYFYTSLSLINPAVKGWYPTILNHHPYKYVYLK